VVNLRWLPGMDSVTEHFDALARLRDAGLIRHLGLSGVTTRQLAEAGAVAPVVCVQNRYGLGLPGLPGGDDAAVLRACGDLGIAFVPFFAIAGARRHGAASETDSDEVRAVAHAHGATPAQVRLAWTLQQGAARAGDPRHRRPGPRDRERRRRGAAADGGGDGPAR
jgi:aryl-alcohol dehydrogenase-like predicted oxidoreductase